MINDMEKNISGDKHFGYIFCKIGMFLIGIYYMTCLQFQIPFINLSFTVLFYFEHLLDYSSIITKMASQISRILVLTPYIFT
uniref:Uncharacterized protein n=1 Tax=Lepeophtheirus salmonis TaxID=72036 RepID=A0A0K2TN89_LEPSM